MACIISEPPPLPDLALYMPLRTAPTKSLPSPRSRHRSLSVRSGGSKSSIPTKNYIPSLATSLEVTLEDIDTRQAGKLFLRNPSLLRDGLSNAFEHLHGLSAWGCSLELMTKTKLSSNPFRSFQMETHPPGNSRPHSLVKGGDLWTS